MPGVGEGSSSGWVGVDRGREKQREERGEDRGERREERGDRELGTRRTLR